MSWSLSVCVGCNSLCVCYCVLSFVLLCVCRLLFGCSSLFGVCRLFVVVCCVVACCKVCVASCWLFLR